MRYWYYWGVLALLCGIGGFIGTIGGFIGTIRGFHCITLPHRFIAHIAEAAKRSPELIQLLELHMQFSTITPYGKSAEPGHMIEKPLTKRDSGMQTEVNGLKQPKLEIQGQNR